MQLAVFYNKLILFVDQQAEQMHLKEKEKHRGAVYAVNLA